MKSIAFRASRLIRPEFPTGQEMMRLPKKRIRIKTVLTVSCSLALLVGAACISAPPPSTNENTFGRTQLTAYKGKVLLLDFYATWCEPCRVETPHLVTLHQRYQSRGLQIIGLNVGGSDDHEQVPAFAKEFGIQFPLAIPDDEFADEYLGINQNIPQTFVLDRQGKVVKRIVGYSEQSAAELDRVIETTLAQTQ